MIFAYGLAAVFVKHRIFMTGGDLTHTQAIELLDEAARELAEIRRGKHYALWRDDKCRPLGDALRQVSPFDAYSDSWIFTGDGGGTIAHGRFGDWAIDRLVEKLEPAAILAAFGEEIAGNVGHYSELSAILGVQLDTTVHLGDGVTLDAEPEDTFEGLIHRIPFQMLPVPSGTSVLRHRYRVEPAFELRTAAPTGKSVTTPASPARDQVRQRVRLACLLASIGPVELPFSLLQPDRASLFVAGDGNQAGRPFAAMPLVAFPVEGAAVKRAYGYLATFRGGASMARAIDRLGRSRLAINPVDRALDLGMAAEIALMHDHSHNNTEIAHKIGSRSAWLLGQTPTDRATIFTEMKSLYGARSQAVHSGFLSSRSTIDLDAADALVTRIFNAILARGAFPDWSSLVMGGDALQPVEDEDGA
ncbi:hypothetical protein Sj15T_30910 [Sphingobium sp. TA15]|uniref:Apea-like HEPN domain-containing protein n=1 Tax=Sphingobium indicum (strain DSM 16413 / CCM 7287 / MTCC 6362 / UT26 / NBRC 101211 / UT26S) TaxID=452662 RepID=D4YXW9_SPHIU|nr:HEPN domain-containing protein [Sphingobium indicum]BAI95201.1 hypothetical protein SJA_C1-03670 [Sphingobium indicum UT26S]BDD68070.1 hypothetical protein Sj15T_30910 [Sphingobium sp. TA15]